MSSKGEFECYNSNIEFIRGLLYVILHIYVMIMKYVPFYVALRRDIFKFTMQLSIPLNSHARFT